MGREKGMDQSATFARHFSRLVWLMMNESGSVDEQKMSLRALVQASKLGPVAISAANLELRANDEVVPGALTGVSDVAARMTAHSVQAFTVAGGSKAPDLLGFARILAADATTNDGGAQVTQKLAALAAGSITLTTVPADPGRLSTAVPVAPPAAAVEPPTVPSPIAAAPAPAPAAPLPAEPKSTPKELTDGAAKLIQQLAARDVSLMNVADLLTALDKAGKDEEANTKALDDLVTLAEHSARIGKPKVVADVLAGVLARDSKLADGEVKSAFVMSLRRLSKPALLRAVAGMLIKNPERKQSNYDILKRTGEDGAEAVIEQVGQARTAEERAALIEVLEELPEAVSALIRMLGDSRWFVVRNAADLLGELVAVKAEDALVLLLRHTDDRVRRSATNALLKLGTPDAVKGVYEAVNDSSPEVRMQAAAAIATRKDGKTSATLIRAIDGEGDPDVQLAMIAALGKVATPEAVAKLVKMAAPEGRLFRKKDAGMRMAAVQALGDAATPAALNSLKELTSDKDKDVRDMATRVLAQAH
jgi:HEAT repeat protein